MKGGGARRTEADDASRDEADGEGDEDGPGCAGDAVAKALEGSEAPEDVAHGTGCLPVRILLAKRRSVDVSWDAETGSAQPQALGPRLLPPSVSRKALSTSLGHRFGWWRKVNPNIAGLPNRLSTLFALGGAT